ncbi:MAG: DEAD/DEAH box helicase [Planctomycetes bacterium]|nr:DEAD/DEAH box helicase [Planctomycetota bacterium]
MTQKLFSDLGLSPEVLKAVERMGFEQASPIQAEAIPRLLEGRDVIGQSQTGSGKTAAFGIPAVELADPTDRAVQVLMLCPTRELASQVAEEISKLAAFKKGVRELPIFGGQSYEHQFRGLKAAPQIVIGTPGRLIDHINQGTLKLDAVKMIVLDEADRMLDMGFREDIEKILESIPTTRQTVLFSATVPPPIRKIIERFTRDPVTVRIEATAMSVPAIEQAYVEVDYRSKTEVLCRLLDLHDVQYGLIFGFTKIQVDSLTEALIARGYSADKLHGDMTQAMRERVMKRFRERRIELLVATDVAARGLDVDDLEIVFNYELPHDAEDYVHRIGRTGRAGKSGKAISLVSGREYGRLQQIIRFTKAKIPRLSVPRLEELEEKHANRLVESLHNTIQGGDFKRQDKLLEDLIEAGHAPGEIVSALMHLLAGESVRAPERIAEDDPRQQRRPTRERSFDDRPPRARDERPRSRETSARSFESGPPPRIDETGIWLKFNVGDNAGVAPGDFVGCIANEADVPRTVIGGIRILATVSFVQVAAEFAEHILASMRGVRLRGRAVNVMPGMPPRRDFNAPGDGPPRRTPRRGS